MSSQVASHHAEVLEVSQIAIKSPYFRPFMSIMCPKITHERSKRDEDLGKCSDAETIREQKSGPTSSDDPTSASSCASGEHDKVTWLLIDTISPVAHPERPKICCSPQLAFPGAQHGAIELHHNTKDLTLLTRETRKPPQPGSRLCQPLRH